MVNLLNQEDRLFSMRQHSYFGVTHCENSELRNEICFGARNLYKDLFSICLQHSVNKNS